MNIPDYSEWNPGEWVPNPDGVTMRFIPFGNTFDLLSEIAPRVWKWEIHGASFEDGRQAALLCGRLRVHYKAVQVAKRKGKFYILYSGESI